MSFNRAAVVSLAVCFWFMCQSAVVAAPLTVENSQPENSQPSDPSQAGASAFAEGNFEEALRQFTLSIEQAPAVGYGNRCLVQLQLQNYAASVEDCSQSLAIDDDNAEVRLNLGLAYDRLGKHEEAITQYEHLLASDAADYRAYYNLGLAKAASERHEAAISDYSYALAELSGGNRSVEWRTVEADMYRDRGASHLILTNYAAAVSDLNAAISRNPNDIWAYFNRGCAYHRSNNFLPAVQDFSWVIEQNSFARDRNAHAYFNRGLIYARLGKADAAIEDLSQSLHLFSAESESPDALVSIHQAHELIQRLRRGDLSETDIFQLLRDRAVNS
ncbi:MAG: tetratricopeptide repeat protein [Cyanobacteria bacterium J06649_4]